MTKQTVNGKMQELLDYIRDTWLQKWREGDWSQYRHLIRTNNDVEGWHNKIKYR